MQPTCVNLWHLFGHEYRVGWDPAYDAEHVPKAKRDPWYFEIHGRYGRVYPHGGHYLAAEVDGHPRIAKALLETIPGAILIQDGDDEKTMRFHFAWFRRVAELLGLKKRRKPLSPERRKEFAAMGAKYRFREVAGLETSS